MNWRVSFALSQLEEMKKGCVIIQPRYVALGSFIRQLMVHFKHDTTSYELTRKPHIHNTMSCHHVVKWNWVAERYIIDLYKIVTL